MGRKPGQGRGGIASERQTSVAFKMERGKVPVGRGAIIGQFLVDGEQVKGDVSEEVTELFSAAQRDASDRINRDRLPRQYQKAVKAYFASADKRINDAAVSAGKGSKADDEGKNESDKADEQSD